MRNPEPRPRGLKLRWLALPALLLLNACAPSPRPQDCARADVFCVGLVTDFGPVNSGIEREAWLALQDARAAGSVDRVDAIETVDVLDRAANIAFLAENGYDMIVTVGASMSDNTIAAATKYPDLSFIGVEQPQETVLPNLAGLVFHEERSGFLAGALASLMTQTGHVGAVCEAKFIEAMQRYCDGFKAGAIYVNAHVDVTVNYRDGATEDLFNDPAWGRDTALKQIAGGTDVLFAAGGKTAEAALEAAASSGTYVIGAETDVYADLLDVRSKLLTSAISDVRAGVLELILLARQNQFPPGDYAGSVELAPWHDLEREIPSQVKEQLQKISLGLDSGEINPLLPSKKP